MIFTTLDDHPLAQLMTYDPISFSLNHPNWHRDNLSTTSRGSHPEYAKPATTISPFDLQLIYKSEYPAPAGSTNSEKQGDAVAKLINVEFLNEGLVTSVNDMVTEVTYQFVAADFLQFASRTHSNIVGNLTGGRFGGLEEKLAQHSVLVASSEGRAEAVGKQLEKLHAQAETANRIKKLHAAAAKKRKKESKE